MAGASAGWTVRFRGCKHARDGCTAARFDVAPSQGAAVAVEVRTTAQIERIPSRELGNEALDARDREAILSVAGRQLIEERLAEEGAVEPRSSSVFSARNATSCKSAACYLGKPALTRPGVGTRGRKEYRLHRCREESADDIVCVCFPFSLTAPAN